MRRAGASSRMGISRLTVSKILNHAEKGVTSIYDRHSYDQDKRGTLSRRRERLVEMASKPRDNGARVAG
jgi:hypothetical protein